MSQVNSMLVKQLTPGFTATVVNAATTTGVAKSSPFAIQVTKSGTQRSLEYNCTGTYTVATLTLQQSFDGGNSWQNVGDALDFAANPVGNLANAGGIVAFVPGVLYQFSVTSFTGTSITVQVATT